MRLVAFIVLTRPILRQAKWVLSCICLIDQQGHQPLTCPGSPTPAPPLAAEQRRGEGPDFAIAENATDERQRDFWGVMRAHTHTHTHKHKHTHTDAEAHECIHIYAHTHTHTWIRYNDIRRNRWVATEEIKPKWKEKRGRKKGEKGVRKRDWWISTAGKIIIDSNSM